MPIHDWTRVDAGLFHAFHQSWAVALQDALNAGALPKGYVALVEQNVRGPVADVLTLRPSPGRPPAPGGSGVAVAAAPPTARHVVARRDAAVYADRANRVAVRHRHGEVVAVVELVSPGNKGGTAELRTFVQKAAGLLHQGVHLVVVDLFPPTRRDPDGIHPAIWAEVDDVPFDRPADKPLTAVGYEAAPNWVAYVEPLAVGDDLPDVPLFLRSGWYVPCPLAATYAATWGRFPDDFKPLLDPPPG